MAGDKGPRRSAQEKAGRKPTNDEIRARETRSLADANVAIPFTSNLAAPVNAAVALKARRRKPDADDR